MPAYLLHLTELAGSLNSSDGASCIVCIGDVASSAGCGGDSREGEEKVCHSITIYEAKEIPFSPLYAILMLNFVLSEMNPF